MFLSFNPHSAPAPRRSRPCFRGDPWSHSLRFPPFCAMEVDLDSHTQGQDKKDDLEALDDLLTNPLRFIHALASAATTPNATESRKRKETGNEDAAAKKSRFEVKLNVEGYKPEEMNIKLVENSLIVSGKHEQTDESGSVSRNFTRTWNIPENVQLDELTCNFNSKDNTMNISAPWKLPLPAPTQEKVIPINVLESATKEKEGTPVPTPETSGEEVTAKVGANSDPTVGA